jgi:hypothetical protein
LIATWVLLAPTGHPIPSQFIAIAQCEGGLTSMTAVNPKSGAFGPFQDLNGHRKTAAKMGLDLNNVKDYFEYNIWLYNTEGTAPWLASKDCWSSLAFNSP